MTALPSGAVLILEHEILNISAQHLPELAAATGAALFVVKHGPLGSDGHPEWHRLESLTEADLEHLPAGTQLYMQPGIACLGGVSEVDQDGVLVYAVALVPEKAGQAQLFLEPTEVMAKLRAAHLGISSTCQILPMKVHGITARAFMEAQHYRAAANAYAQNAIELQKGRRALRAQEVKLEAVRQSVFSCSEAEVKTPEHWQAIYQALAMSVVPEQA